MEDNIIRFTPLKIINNNHPWTELPHITDDIVSFLVNKINTNQFSPRKIYNLMNANNLYLNSKQLRTIHSGCSKLYSNYSTWYLYDHALCSRVTDCWNLTPKYGVEGYYYCSIERAKDLSVPPHKWDAMQLDRFS